MSYGLEALFGLLMLTIGYLARKTSRQLKEEVDCKQALKSGMQAILRDSIIKAYNKHTEKGYCEVHDKDNICNLYAQYHSLEGNGVIDSLMEELYRLPVKEEKKTYDRRKEVREEKKDR